MSAVLSTTEQVNVMVPLIADYFAGHAAAIPSLNAHSTRVMALGNSVMDISMSELVLLVRSDAASAAQLLRVANSPLYRRNASVQAVDEAIIRLGRREVYALMIAMATRSMFEPKLKMTHDMLPQHWYRLQHHSVTAAFGSGWLASTLSAGAYENGFLGGMFHDIGKLGVLYCLTSLLMQEAFDFEVSFAAAAEAMEVLHVDVGCAMLRAWGLPKFTEEICARHHSAMAEDDPLKVLIHVIRVVSSLDTLRDNAYVPTTLDAELRASLDALALHGDVLKSLAPKLQKITDNVTQLLGPNLGRQDGPL